MLYPSHRPLGLLVPLKRSLFDPRLRIGFHWTEFKQLRIVVADRIPQIRNLVTTILQLGTDQIKLIENRILDLNANIRRKPKGGLEVVQSLLVTELLLQ